MLRVDRKSVLVWGNMGDLPLCGNGSKQNRLLTTDGSVEICSVQDFSNKSILFGGSRFWRFLANNPNQPSKQLRSRLQLRLSENAHLPFGRLTALSKVEGLRYPRPSSLRCTSMYASFLGTSEALHLGIFHQPLRSRFFDSLTAILENFGPSEVQNI